jgi:predicted nucleotidyltransferase
VTDFPALLRTLVQHDVRFIIVGGLAATVHGSARLTQDIDVVYDRSDDNITRVVDALSGLNPYLRGAPPGLPFEWSSETLRRGLNFTLTTSAGAIDLLGEIPGGPTHDELVRHTIEIELFGTNCRCLDLPALIRTKRAAGRPKDLEAIAELEILLEGAD